MSWAMVAGVLLLVWVASYPRIGVPVLLVVGSLVVGGRALVRLARCISECRRLTIPLGRNVHLTVGEPCACEP